MQFRLDMYIMLKRGRSLINIDKKDIERTLFERTLFESYGMIFTADKF